MRRTLYIVPLVFLFMVPWPLPAQVVVNEVHPTPAAGEPEWVELENRGLTSQRLTGWWLCDARSCIQLPAVVMPAKGLIVVSRDTAALREQRFIPRGVLVLECAVPSLNNTTDGVLLRRPDSTLVDSSVYRVVVKGRSLERTGSGWTTTVARDSATCGRLNSTVVLDRDLRIVGITPYGSPPSLAITFINAGRTSFPSFRAACDIGKGPRRTMEMPGLAPGEETVWRLQVEGQPNDTVDVLVWHHVVDERSENDTAATTIVVPPLPGNVAVMEILTDPPAGRHDYIELWNRSGTMISLAGWMLVDQQVNGESDTVVLPAVDVPDGARAVLTADVALRARIPDSAVAVPIPSGFNLDADGDSLWLLNASGFVVDACVVDVQWHATALPATKGVSFERWSYDAPGQLATSWASSSDPYGGTPGAANAIGLRARSDGSSLEAHPPAFSSKRSSGTFPCRIAYTQPYAYALMDMRVTTMEGLPVRTLVNAVVGGRQGAVFWDGTDANGMSVHPGPYLVVFTALDTASTNSTHSHAVVTVGE